MDSQYIATYKEEAYELLSELEASLLELEDVPDDEELIGRIFRSMHTIKGSGAMFGFDNIANFTHELEAVFDMVRDGKIPITKPLVNLSFSACDLIRKMVNEEDIDKAKKREIIESFRNILYEFGEKEEETSKIPDPQPIEKSSDIYLSTTYGIRFRPDPDIFENGTNPTFLLRELEELGECNIICHTDAIPQLKIINPQSCYLYWDIILATSKGINAIRDIFIFVEDNCQLDIAILDKQEQENLEDEANYKKLGEILVERGYISEQELKKALNNQKRVGEILLESKAIAPDILASALIEQKQAKAHIKKRQEASSSASIRVAAEKLDVLVNLVGELVTLQARLSQKALSQDDPELNAIAEEVDRLTSELRDNTMSIRMLPIGATFSKFRRLIRDLSEELGKDVIMKADGEDTELDKTVIEQLNDPLVHIIRNAIDHGIEMPQIREALEKPGQGTILLKAEHSGSDVVIRISDDGAGIDPDAIRQKAIEKKLIAPDAELTEKEIFSLIFLPGFSTAKKVSEVSGRGVGLDVVKRRVESLRGSAEIISQKGIGTTITLKLPLTLAIADGLLVKIGEGYFVFPLSNIEECIELKRVEADKAHDRNMINFRGEILTYLSLRNMFNVIGELPVIEQVVIVEANNERVGFGVDQVIGQRQTVIKALGKFYRNIKNMSGATILGDGTVALILDVYQLIQSVKNEKI